MSATNRELLGFQQDDQEIERESATQIAQQQSQLAGNQSSKSPHKSIAIKGPPRVINETLEIDNY